MGFLNFWVIALIVWGVVFILLGLRLVVNQVRALLGTNRRGVDILGGLAGVMAAAFGVVFVVVGVDQAKENAAAPFVAAAGKGDIAAVRRMLDADPGLIRADQAFHDAAADGHADVVELLLSRGADVNSTSSNRYTALHEAGDGILAMDRTTPAIVLAVVNVLIARHANVNARSTHQATPLHVHADNADVVAALLAHGADARAADADGETPLHQAARAYFDNSDSVQLLLEHGADPDARNSKGETPLLLASSGEPVKLDTLALLCSHGAKPDTKDNAGLTPLDGARARLAKETDPDHLKTRRAVVEFLSPTGGCSQSAATPSRGDK